MSDVDPGTFATLDELTVRRTDSKSSQSRCAPSGTQNDAIPLPSQICAIFGDSAGGDGEVVDGRLVLVVGRELPCQGNVGARARLSQKMSTCKAVVCHSGCPSVTHTFFVETVSSAIRR